MYLESRRTFLKGAAFTVAGATIAKGVLRRMLLLTLLKIASLQTLRALYLFTLL